MSSSAGQSIVRFGDNIRRFIKLESSAGLILMAATILAMIVKNSPLATAYQSLLLLEGEVRFGSLAIQKPLLLWVNDFWMAIFFFLVGMEIKREWIEGYLSDLGSGCPKTACKRFSRASICAAYSISPGSVSSGFVFDTSGRAEKSIIARVIYA